MKPVLALVLIDSILFISSCETFRGLGKNVENADEWVQEKAS